MTQQIFTWNAPQRIMETPRPAAERAEGKRQRVLERLAEGPQTCVTIERDPHRGQAVVRELRQRGHIIDTVILDGEPHYVYHGRRAMCVAVTAAMQEAYYQTSHWRSIARDRKQIDNWRCVQCGISDELETHHWRYTLFGEDVRLDLCTLCQPCHKGIHHEARGSRGIHFPRFVSQEVAAQITGA